MEIGLVGFFRILFLSLLPLSLLGNVYILSYKIVVQNGTILNDSLYVSPLMVSSKKFQYEGFIQLEGAIRDSDRYIIEKNRELILERLFKDGIIIRDFSENRGLSNNSQTTIILPPIYVALERDSLDIYLIILKEI